MDAFYEKFNLDGRFQKLIIFLIGTLTGLVGFTTYASVFTNASPEILCKYADDNETNIIQNANTCDIISNITSNKESSLTQVYECSYDKTYYGVTLITELDLVCDKSYLANLSQTIFMIGCFSTFFIGHFSDKYGRKKVLIFVALVTNVALILCTLLQQKFFNLSNSSRYIVYAASQYILGFSTYVIEIVSYVLLIEITSLKLATVASICYLNMYVFGELYVLIISYFARNWHILYICLTCYSLLITLVIIFIIPESPKFLIVNERFSEAAKLFNKINKFNGNDSNKEITSDDVMCEANKIHKDEAKNKTDDEDVDIYKYNDSAWFYITHPLSNLVKLVLIGYLWIAISMVYFGVSLGITSISSSINPYFMFFISSMAEIVGYSLAILGNKYSRNTLLKICLFAAGCCCMIIAFIPKSSTDAISWNVIIIAVCVFIGKSMSSTSFNLIYLYTNQLYPTFVRNTLVSCIASAGRFGSLISPQINLLGDLVWGPLPYIIFSGSSLLGCGFLFFLPDPSKFKQVM